jgi:hypothetical protein
MKASQAACTISRAIETLRVLKFIPKTYVEVDGTFSNMTRLNRLGPYIM